MLSRLLFALIGFAALGSASAQQLAYQEGRHYHRIAVAQPTHAPAGKFEVVEVFSYACHACARFQPVIDPWLANLPPDVSFEYVPADFNPGWPLMAKAYYVADALGLHDQTHQAIFNANFVENKPLRTDDDVIAFLARHGKSTDEVSRMAKSVGIQARLAQARKRVIAYGVDSTPTLIVNGKWRISGDGLSSYEEMLAVLKYVLTMDAIAQKSAKPAG